MAQSPSSVVYTDPHVKDILGVCAVYNETTGTERGHRDDNKHDRSKRMRFGC